MDPFIKYFTLDQANQYGFKNSYSICQSSPCGVRDSLVWVHPLVVGHRGILPTIVVYGALVLVQVRRDQVGSAA